MEAVAELAVMTVPLRVAIYARVSTTEQNPEAQLTALREYAAGRGFVIQDEYVDHLSGDRSPRSRRPRRTKEAAFDRKRYERTLLPDSVSVTEIARGFTGYGGGDGRWRQASSQTWSHG